MILKKLKQNNKKACPANSGGFVILFAVMVSSIILAIALGVANVALKEMSFGTSAKDTNDAFFAADIGAECALYLDRSDIAAFGNTYSKEYYVTSSGSYLPTVCAGQTLDVSTDGTTTSPLYTWNFEVPNLGSNGKSCAIVTFVNDPSNPPGRIVSKGYNNAPSGTDANGINFCTPASNSVERSLEVTYDLGASGGGGGPPPPPPPPPLQ